MRFIAWPEILGFHNIRKFIRVDPGEWWQKKQLLSGDSKVLYKAKVKLHGTNAAVQVLNDGTVVAQSRENIITPEKDNAGFARWVKANEQAWRDTVSYESNWDGKKQSIGMIFYGEWIGPGIQKGVAVSAIPKKAFVVFACRPFGKDDLPQEDVLITNPNGLKLYLEKVPDTYVLPWYEKSIEIDWKLSDEELTKVIAPINDWVLEIEKNDPWVEATFGIKGTGEGLVFYPESDAHKGSMESFTNLCFKAKGEKHKNIATAAPAQVSAEAAASIDAFVGMVLTHSRLEQGATKVSSDGALTYDLKNTGKFVNWVSADVEKETQDELAASGLTFKQVQRAISDKARAWYIGKAKQ